MYTHVYAHVHAHVYTQHELLELLVAAVFVAHRTVEVDERRQKPLLAVPINTTPARRTYKYNPCSPCL